MSFGASGLALVRSTGWPMRATFRIDIVSSIIVRQAVHDENTTNTSSDVAFVDWFDASGTFLVRVKTAPYSYTFVAPPVNSDGSPTTFTLKASVALTPTIQNTLSGLPDVPLSSFQLVVNGGPRGLLNAGDLCSGAAPTISGTFTAHSGATANVTSPVTVVGCDPTATAAGRGFKGAHPRLTLKVVQGAGSPLVKRITMTLPRDIQAAGSKGTSVRSAAALPRGDYRLSRKGVFSISIPAGGAHRANATLAKGAIVPSPHLKRLLRRHRSVTLQLALKIVDANGNSTSLTVPLRAAR